DHPKTPTARSFQSATTPSDFMTTTASSVVSRVGRNSSRRGYSPRSRASRGAARCLGIFALWRRALASLLLALVRRRITHPKAQHLRRSSRHDYSRELRPAKWGFGVCLHGSNGEPLMSALGQKQAFRNVRVMSALPPKADITVRSSTIGRTVS